MDSVVQSEISVLVGGKLCSLSSVTSSKVGNVHALKLIWSVECMFVP